MFRKAFKTFSKTKIFKPTLFGATSLFSAFAFTKDDLLDDLKKVQYYNQLYNFKELKRVCEEGLKKDPNNLAFIVYLFYSNVFLIQTEEAEVLDRKLAKWKAETPEDQYYLGLYHIAKGNVEKGYEMIEKSASKGCVEAIHELGKMLYLMEDNLRGLKLIQEAYNLGHDYAKFSLIDLYLNSKNFGDPFMASKMLKEVENDHEIPYEILFADAYLYGIGVERDTDKGMMYLKKAADQGNSVAQYRYSLLMSALKNYDESFSYAKKCSDSGHPDVRPHLAELYIEGLGHPRDLQTGFTMLSQSAEYFHDTKSMMKLGNYFLNGKYLDVNPEAASQLYKECTIQSVPLCNYFLGMCYVHGIGVEKDLKTAKELLKNSPMASLLENDEYLNHIPDYWKNDNKEKN